MTVITLLFAFIMFGYNHVMGQEALIGEHVNATHFVREYTDIQSHINSAIGNGFKHLKIAQGTYFIARSILISTPNITISGLHNRTTLLLRSTRPLGLAMFVVSDTSNVSFTNLMLNGYNNASRNTFEVNGIAFVNVSSCIISGVHSKNFRNGIFVNGSFGLVFEDVHVTTCQYDGWLVRNSSSLSINGSSSSFTGRHGIAVVGNSININITRNNVSNSNIGIRMEQTNLACILNNTITNNDIGVYLKSLFNVQVSTNTITSTKDAKCIDLNNILQGQFINNECNTNASEPTIPSSHNGDVHKPSPSPVPTPHPPPKRNHKSGSVTVRFSNSLLILAGLALVMFIL